jgi:hypothetical protein
MDILMRKKLSRKGYTHLFKNSLMKTSNFCSKVIILKVIKWLLTSSTEDDGFELLKVNQEI